MTWTPKVGDWGVDARGVAVRYAGIFSGRQLWEDHDPSVPENFVTVLSAPMRPATIDEIPGNTSEEWRHDRALGAALGIDSLGTDTLPSLIDWQYLEGMGYLR